MPGRPTTTSGKPTDHAEQAAGPANDSPTSPPPKATPQKTRQIPRSPATDSPPCEPAPKAAAERKCQPNHSNSRDRSAIRNRTLPPRPSPLGAGLRDRRRIRVPRRPPAPRHRTPPRPVTHRHQLHRRLQTHPTRHNPRTHPLQKQNPTRGNLPLPPPPLV